MNFRTKIVKGKTSNKENRSPSIYFLDPFLIKWMVIFTLISHGPREIGKSLSIFIYFFDIWTILFSSKMNFPSKQVYWFAYKQENPGSNIEAEKVRTRSKFHLM